MSWLAVLPLIGFLATFFLIRALGSEVEQWGERDSFAAASLVWCAYLLLITEFLGAFQLLTRLAAALSWLALPLVLIAVFGRRLEASIRTFPLGQLRPRARPDVGAALSSMIVGLVVICLMATLLVAVLSPPNDGDVLEYHMGRVVHWIQNRSVDHYATPDSRQLWVPPLAEYVSLHFYLLWGDDTLANLAQWLSLAGAVVVGSRMAALLGAGRVGQALSALLIATVPTAIHQATTALTDLAAAYWVLVIAWVLLMPVHRLPLRPGAALAGLSAGLVLLTKGSAAPFLVMLFLIMFFMRRDIIRSPRALEVAAIVTALVLAPNLPHWARNFTSFQSPLGPAEHLTTLRTSGSLVVSAFSNNLRSLAILAAVPFDNVNAITNQAVARLHSLAGIELNPPGATHPGSGFGVGWRWPGFNSAPVQVGLFLLAAALAIVRRWDGDLKAMQLFAATSLGFLLYNTMFSYQGATRFILPALLLAAPLTGAVLDRHFRALLLAVPALAVMVYALPVLFANPSRPLVSLPGYTFLPSVFEQADLIRYFRGNEALVNDYTHLANEARAQGCGQIGLRINSGDPEYLWWVVLRPLEADLRVEHMLVLPELERYQDPTFEPCVVLCTVCGEGRTSFAGLLLQGRLGSLTIFY